jgi:hypothetical protein
MISKQIRYTVAALILNAYTYIYIIYKQSYCLGYALIEGFTFTSSSYIEKKNRGNEFLFHGHDFYFMARILFCGYEFYVLTIIYIYHIFTPLFREYHSLHEF